MFVHACRCECECDFSFLSLLSNWNHKLMHIECKELCFNFEVENQCVTLAIFMIMVIIISLFLDLGAVTSFSHFPV